MSLLETPNPDDPLDGSIAELYKSDREQHDLQARIYTTKYAI